MKLRVKREIKANDYTIGKLYIDEVYFCDTLEDKDRGLDSKMPIADLRRLKNPGATAIPTGTYEITMRVFSGKFGARPFYSEVCKGLLPRLMSVPVFDGVLIHCGNTDKDTEGCILVGKHKTGTNCIVESQKTFRELYAKLKSANNDIQITIE